MAVEVDNVADEVVINDNEYVVRCRLVGTCPASFLARFSIVVRGVARVAVVLPSLAYRSFRAPRAPRARARDRDTTHD